MAENTKITWAHHTFNPWIGCTKIAAGCKFCYAEKFAGHYMKVGWGDKAKRHITADSTWAKPLVWNRKAEKEKTRYRVFCASLADVFEDRPELHEPRMRLFELIEATPHLDWLILTKRPQNIILMLPEKYMGMSVPENIWWIASCSTQKDYDANYKHLNDLREMWGASVIGISFEPLLERIDMKFGLPDWAIIGGESGFLKDARPMDLKHADFIIEQMKYNPKRPLPVFFKQFGTQIAKKLKLAHAAGEDWDQWPAQFGKYKIREFPTNQYNDIVSVRAYNTTAESYKSPQTKLDL